MPSGILISGIILPSGESNFFDTVQLHANNYGSGINAIYPSPSGYSDEYWEVSGIYKTYPSTGQTNLNVGSGIFNYNYLHSVFSSGAIINSGISGIFNHYIHHYARLTGSIPVSTVAVTIPFVSNYRVTLPFNVYSVENNEFFSYEEKFIPLLNESGFWRNSIIYSGVMS